MKRNRSPKTPHASDSSVPGISPETDAFDSNPLESAFGDSTTGARLTGRSNSEEIPMEIEQRLRSQLETFRHDLGARSGTLPRRQPSRRGQLTLSSIYYAIGVVLVLLIAAILFYIAFN